jgi:hypothetical protein
MILPSNSSMQYFPENTTSSFITELPQTVELHGEWEVALSEIQFPCSFFHVRQFPENEIRFLTSPDESYEIDGANILTAPFVLHHRTIQCGIYQNIEDLIQEINSYPDSHFVFEIQKEGGKLEIGLNCDDEKCGMIHYMNFSDNLFRILGCETELGIKNNLFFREIKVDIRSNECATFFRLGFKLQEGSERISYYQSKEPCSLWRGIPDKLFVYCDICEAYVTGDVQSPLLRIVPVESRESNYAYGTNQVKHFSVPFYIPLRQTRFRRIEIDIRDQLGKKIPFESGTLTVTLHFKRAR